MKQELFVDFLAQVRRVGATGVYFLFHVTVSFAQHLLFLAGMTSNKFRNRLNEITVSCKAFSLAVVHPQLRVLDALDAIHDERTRHRVMKQRPDEHELVGDWVELKEKYSHKLEKLCRAIAVFHSYCNEAHGSRVFIFPKIWHFQSFCSTVI